MKLLFYYFCALALAWAGVNSLLVGLAYWDNNVGAPVPMAAGLLLLLLAARFIILVVRLYLPPDHGESRELED